MSAPAISPVLSRIQTIESRLGVPAGMRLAPPGAGSDFAAHLSAAFSNSSTAVDATGATVASSAAPPVPDTFTGALGLPGAAPAPGTYAVLTAELNRLVHGIGGTGPIDGIGSPSIGGTPFADEFAAAGARHGVPADLLSAVGWVESRYQTDAVSSAGAQGVMQLMPFVSDEYGVDPFDPVEAIDAGAHLLRSHFDRFGSWDLALAAYNAGAGAVSRAGNTIPSPGVAEYVRRVNERMTA